MDTIPLNERELAVLRQCHQTIFKDVLEIRASYLQPDLEGSERAYMIVPLEMLPPEVGLDVYIDRDLAASVAQTGSNPGLFDSAPQWPCPLEKFTNALVTGIHCARAERQLHEVLSVDPDITPSSPFPDPRFPTYTSYFESKYNFRFRDMNQPALKCKKVSIGESRLKLLTSRFKSVQGQELKKKKATSLKLNREIVLFPECCSLYPLPANFWLLARCLPSLLWRLECSLLVDELRSCIARNTSIGLEAGEVEYVTSTTLQGYQDYGFGDLQTQCFSINNEGQEEACGVEHFPSCTLRGPDNALLLQALTPKSANDSINLERLETLGDSFLKLATSVYLFCERPKSDHEGKLSSARSRRVGNLNLYLLAKKRQIPGKVFSRIFNPKQMWVPPCHTFRDSGPSTSSSAQPPSFSDEGDGVGASELSERTRDYQYHKVTDKGVADCVESLIGAYLVSGGVEAGLKFMKWVGIKINKPQEQPVQQPPSPESSSDDEEGQLHSSSGSFCSPPMAKRPKAADTCPLLIKGSSSIFSHHFTSPPSALLDSTKRNEVQRLLRVSRASILPHLVQGKINWTFQDPSYLLQALTHASYIKNRITDCYQRLEFLGDAVLDYLVTCYVYQKFPEYGPGEISCMRSALVNNNTFAELAVHLELHKAVLHSSPKLFKQIELYLEALQLNGSNGSMGSNAVVQEVHEEDSEAIVHVIEPSEDPMVSVGH